MTSEEKFWAWFAIISYLGCAIIWSLGSELLTFWHGMFLGAFGVNAFLQAVKLGGSK